MQHNCWLPKQQLFVVSSRCYNITGLPHSRPALLSVTLSLVKTDSLHRGIHSTPILVKTDSLDCGIRRTPSKEGLARSCFVQPLSLFNSTAVTIAWNITSCRTPQLLLQPLSALLAGVFLVKMALTVYEWIFNLIPFKFSTDCLYLLARANYYFFLLSN